MALGVDMTFFVLSAAFAIGGLVMHVYHLRGRTRRLVAIDVSGARGDADLAARERDSFGAALSGLPDLQGELIFTQIQREALASRVDVPFERMKFRADSALTAMRAMRESLHAVASAQGGASEPYAQYLLDFVQTFECWHSDLETMFSLYASGARMNTDFTEVSCDLAIASQMVKIEALRLGSDGERFLKSASELVELSRRAQDVSLAFDKALRDGALAAIVSLQQLSKFEQHADAVVAAS